MMLCGFCNAPWDERMIMELDHISAGCDTCGYGESATVTATIECQNCKRVIYKKEYKVGASD